MEYQCSECGKVFSNASNIRKHARKFHDDKSNEIAPNRYKNASIYAFNCQCGKNFSNKANFRSHQNIHDNKTSPPSSPKINKKCPLCEESFITKADIFKHFEETHDIIVKPNIAQFNSEQEFLEWKEHLELKSITRFVKVNNKNSNKCNISYFACNRSGNYAPQIKEPERQRHLKMQGTNKINGYCPVSIKLINSKDNGACKAEYIVTHVGHVADLGHMSLSKTERQRVAQKISTKVPFDAILDEVRETVNDSELNRLHLLTRKDLCNIERSFNLSSSAVRHANDGVSVESWVREMQEEKNCILFYKPQGTIAEDQPYLKEEDFVLIIMTTAQKEFLSKYGSDVICLDGTHGTNNYNFELNTLLVLDDLREGFPCSFLISNRSDQYVFKLLFNKIKEEIGIITPKIFMSDMAESYSNAWMETMGAPQKRLFCTWHVLRAWKKNLGKIKTKDKQDALYKQLQILLKETDREALVRMLLHFRNHREDPDAADFISYFEVNYLHNLQSWAYAYRLHSGINTNMHLERFHKTLKYIYLKGQNVKRLDKGICAIMRLVRDRLFDRLISRHKGKICSKVKEIRNRHKKLNTLHENLLVESELGWEIPSEATHEIYLIQKTESTCSKCQLKCVECNICIHQYICSCIDSSIKFNMCKHIHLVAHLERRKIKDRNIEPDGDIGVRDGNHELTIFVDEDAEEKNCILNEVVKKKALKRSLEEEKEEIKGKIARHLDNIKSPTKISIIKNMLAPLSPTLAAISSCANNSLPVTSSNLVPHNKKIVPQRSLFSTKKKLKASKNPKRPTTNDTINLLMS